jgi:hypothetical protein
MDQPFEPGDLDEVNPYAPPRSTFRPSAPNFESVAVRFTIGDILERSWTIFKERMGACLAVVLGIFVLNFGMSFAISILLQILIVIVKQPAFILFGQFVMQIVVTAISVWLTIGQNLGLLKIARRQPVSPEHVFQGGPYVVTVIVASILIGLIVFLPIFLCVVAAAISFAVFRGDQAPVAVAVLVVCVAAILPVIMYLTARMGMFYFLAIDRNAGVLDSLRWSWELTRGRALPIIAIYLLSFLINVGGALACLVGLIFTIPLTSLIVVVTYLALMGQEGAGKPAQDIWEADEFA